MGDRLVAVIGLGYIGLPTAVMLASNGLLVVGVDTDADRVRSVMAGEAPFIEPGLGEALESVVRQKSLTAVTAMPEADVFIIAVPTPFGPQHKVDLVYIDAAVDSIAPRLRGGELIILESTCPPGTTEHVAERMLAARPDLHDLEFAHAPERVLPGRAMEELVVNDRVLGGLTASAGWRAKQLYSSFCRGVIHLTDARTAELSKLAENSFRDVNIAYANELSVICHDLGIDVWELIEMANHHPRVNILQPGPGVGGHCIAVDPWFIVSSCGDDARLIRTARGINDSKPGWVLDRVREAVEGRPEPVIAVLGLAFKPDIDDLRESPAVEIARALPSVSPGATMLVAEPFLSQLPAGLSGPRIELTDLDTAVERADVVLVLVNHTAFGSLGEEQLAGKVVIDTRGLLRHKRQSVPAGAVPIGRNVREGRLTAVPQV